MARLGRSRPASHYMPKTYPITSPNNVTPISDSDTGAFVDDGESISAAVSSADTGSGAEGQSVVVAGGVPFLDQYVSGYTLLCNAYFGADPTADPSTWTPTDITADILQGDGSQGISITRGRMDEFSQTAPSICQFTLKNGTDGGNGNYTPDRVDSIYWPYVDVGLPVKVVINSVTGSTERFSGFVDEIDPVWDETGNVAQVNVTVHGALQRISQGDNPLHSALYRAIQSDPNLVAYWPMEDPSGSRSAASGLSGGVPMLAVNGAPISFGDAGPGGSSPLPNFSNGSMMLGRVRTGSNSWVVTYAFRPNDTSTTDAIGSITIVSGGFTFQVVCKTSNFSINLSGRDFNGGAVANYSTLAAPAAGSWAIVQVAAVNSGSDFKFSMWVNGTGSSATTITGYSVGSITQVQVGDLTGAAPALIQSTNVNVGHVAVSYPCTLSGGIPTPANAALLASAVTGYDGEDPVTRASRLCSENSVPFVADGTSTVAMGPQTQDTLYNLLRSCEDAEGGVLEDGVNFGLSLHTIGIRYNPSVNLALTIQQLEPLFIPVKNNLRIRNSVTVSRTGGSSATFTRPTGYTYASGGAGGIGTINTSETLNLQDDTTLPNRAGWLVHVGTVLDARFPVLSINFSVRTTVIASWLTCGLGSRITVSGHYSTGITNSPNLIVEGWTEVLSRLVYHVSVNNSPEIVWRVAVVDDTARGRVGGFGTTLHANITSGATSLVVDSPSPWTTTALRPTDFPFDINLNGERVTVGSITGAATPYTFGSLTRAVNGVSKAHTAGESIDVWRPGVISL